jgi:hypothetical protein
MSYNSDTLAGLDYIFSIRGSYKIAAVNMSLGGGGYSSFCDSDSRKASIDNLRNAGIATAIATGNNGYCGYISSPGCISSAISVGSSTNSTGILLQQLERDARRLFLGELHLFVHGASD